MIPAVPNSPVPRREHALSPEEWTEVHRELGVDPAPQDIPSLPTVTLTKEQIDDAARALVVNREQHEAFTRQFYAEWDAAVAKVWARRAPVATVTESAATAETRAEVSRLLAELHRIQSELTSSPYSHDMIELTLATVISNPLSQTMEWEWVWLLIVLNPSSDKTQSLAPLRGHPKIIFSDDFTESSFASGFVDPDRGRARKQKHRDLLSEIRDTGAIALIVKDLTTLLSGGDDKVRRVLGALQSIYDGNFDKSTGTLGRLSYRPAFSFIGAVTPTAFSKHQQYLAQIGNRFLTYRAHPLSPEDRQAGLDMTWALAGDREKKRALTRRLQEIVHKIVTVLLTTPFALEPESEDVHERLNQLAMLLRLARADVQYRATDVWDEEQAQMIRQRVIEFAQIEEPYRALQQLITLTRCLALLHGRSGITEHELELARRVVLSSLPLKWSRVLGCFRSREAWLTPQEVSNRVNIALTWARQTIAELVYVELLEKEGDAQRWEYRISPNFANLIASPIEPMDHLRD